MHRLRLFKILFIHTPTLFKRFFLLMFRKNSQLKFHYLIKNKAPDSLNLLENQIALNIDIQNGLILKIDKSYIPLLSDSAVLSINVPVKEQNGKIQIKVIGFFKTDKVSISLDRNESYAKTPKLSNNQLISKLKIIDSANSRVKLLKVQIASKSSKPILLNGAHINTRTAKLNPITEPSFKHDIEKLKLKLNQEL